MKKKLQKSQIEPPPPTQIWSILQRLVSFEEPAPRWQRINAMLARFTRAAGTKDLDALPLSQQYEFHTILLGQNTSGAARQFNLLLAIEDIGRYTQSAFDAWYYSYPHEDRVLHPLALELGRELACNESQTAWLDMALSASPDWSILSAAGPWNDDPLAVFTTAVLGRLTGSTSSCRDLIEGRLPFLKRLAEARKNLPAQILPQAIVLVEGPTEAVLIPRFASLQKKELADLGVLVVACGGARQIVRRYVSLSDATTLPILIVIDGDADEEISSIQEILRSTDKLHVWESGELEDVLGKAFLLRHVNRYLAHLGEATFIADPDLPGSQRRTTTLDRLWRERGLGDFDKVGFAEFLAGSITRPEEVPVEAQKVVAKLSDLVKQR